MTTDKTLFFVGRGQAVIYCNSSRIYVVVIPKLCGKLRMSCGKLLVVCGELQKNWNSLYHKLFSGLSFVRSEHVRSQCKGIVKTFPQVCINLWNIILCRIRLAKSQIPQSVHGYNGHVSGWRFPAGGGEPPTNIKSG